MMALFFHMLDRNPGDRVLCSNEYNQAINASDLLERQIKMTEKAAQEAQQMLKDEE